MESPVASARNDGGMPDDAASRQPAKGNDAFAAALLDPDIAMPDGVTDPGGKQAPKRYSVYRNNVVVSLMEALCSAYPALVEIMGQETFDRIARNFIVAEPPASPMMQYYGAGFADFLDGFPPLAKSPFLGDVARAERGWLEAYHAADRPALEAGDLAGLDEAAILSLRLDGHPAAHLVASQWPVFDLFGWRDGRPAEGADLQQSQCLAISRPALEVRVHLLEPSLHDFAAALLSGAMLGEAAEQAMQRDDAFDLAEALAFVLNSGLFAKPGGSPDGDQSDNRG